MNEQRPPFGVPEYVLLEVATILAKKAGMEYAKKFIEIVFNNRDCIILVTDESLCRSTANMYIKEDRAELSFVNMSLLVLGKQHKVITFDTPLSKRLKLHGAV